MELSFGTRKNGNQYCLVVSEKHTDWKDCIAIERPFNDCEIRDIFTVIKRYKTATDPEGRCYDWYEIKDHSQTIDKTKSVIPDIEQNKADIAYIAIEADIDLGGL